MEELLRELLNKMEQFDDRYFEFGGDTVVREALYTAIHEGFIQQVPGYRLPWFYGLISPVGNLRVRKALGKYIRDASVKARELGLNTPHQREEAFAGYGVVGDAGTDVSEYFGAVGEVITYRLYQARFTFDWSVYNELLLAASMSVHNEEASERNVVSGSAPIDAISNTVAPEHVAVWHWLKYEMDRMKMRNKQAVIEIRQAVAADMGNLLLHLDLADALVKNRELAEAISEYRHVLVLDPDNENARRSLEAISKPC
jgi:hypothetical protein